MFNDHAFRDRVGLAGVNSINWARIVAQAVYYFTAAVALGAPHRAVTFTVPTGNFGDIFAGLGGEAHGPPIDRLVIATNQNDILPRARGRRLETPRSGGGDRLARRWTSRSPRTSSGYLVRGLGPVTALMRARWARSRSPADSSGGARPALRAEFAAAAAGEAETTAAIA